MTPSKRSPKIVNLTGHPVTLTDGVASVRVESSGRARVNHMDTLSEFVNVSVDEFVEITLPLLNVKEQSVYGLPDEQEGVLYVVSGIVQVVAGGNGRTDVVAPGRFVRKGRQVLGAGAFVRVQRKESEGSE